MIIYLIKMIACSAAFYALYHFVFQREKMLVFNRFYLLGSLVASFFIPLITFTVEAPQQVQFIPVDYENYQPAIIKADKYNFNEYLLIAATTIFVIVSAFLTIRFFVNLYKVQKGARNAEQIPFEEASIVLLNEKVIPYSFFNKIFVNGEAFKRGRVEDSILIHELAHIKQRHSWDIIFIELLQIVSWFSPVIYLYKRAIKINHEFLADEAVVKSTSDSLSYQQLLLQSIYVNNNIPFASSFYFFTTKKRILMLQKTFKRKRGVLAAMAVLPLLTALVYVLSARIYAQVNSANTGQSDSTIYTNVAIADLDDKKNASKYGDVEYRNGLLIKGDTGVLNTVKKIERITGGKVFEITPDKNFIKDTVPPAPPPPPPPPTSKQLPANVKTVNVHTANGIRTAEIIYKDGRKVTEDISTSAKEKAFEKKYGLALPPPPPTLRESSNQKTNSFSPTTIVRDDVVVTALQSKLKEETVPEYDDKGNKIPRLQIVGTKEEVENLKARHLNSTEGRSNSDIKEVLVQYDKQRPKQYAIITYKDNNFYNADISTPQKKKAFEKKYQVKLSNTK